MRGFLGIKQGRSQSALIYLYTTEKVQVGDSAFTQNDDECRRRWMVLWRAGDSFVAEAGDGVVGDELLVGQGVISWRGVGYYDAAVAVADDDIASCGVATEGRN